MFWITKKRIRRKIEKAKKNVAKIVQCVPEEYIKNAFLIKIRLSKYCSIDFEITNPKEIIELSKKDGEVED